MRAVLAIIACSGLTIAITSSAAADGYWLVDHAEFVTQAGGMDWIGQAGTKVRVLSHDAENIVVREDEPRGYSTQTYDISWYVPGRLIPGQVAPFTLEETCKEASVAPNWPIQTQKMGPASLQASFNRDGYMQIGDAPCLVDRKTSATALTWKIPPGKAGDMAVITIQSVPTYSSSIEHRVTFKWVGGTAPASTRKNPAGGSTAAPPHHVDSQWQPPANNTGMEPLTAPPEPTIIHNGADGGVTPGTTRPTTFDLAKPTLVTQIMTYHYGSRAHPGTIALRHQDGTMYGPWQAAGAVGGGGAANAYWWVRPNVTLKPGRYTVIDSDPSTWCREAATAGAGIMVIWGR